MVVAPDRFLGAHGDHGIWLGRWAKSINQFANRGDDVLAVVRLEVPRTSSTFSCDIAYSFGTVTPIYSGSR